MRASRSTRGASRGVLECGSGAVASEGCNTHTRAKQPKLSGPGAPIADCAAPPPELLAPFHRKKHKIVIAFVLVARIKDFSHFREPHAVLLVSNIDLLFNVVLYLECLGRRKVFLQIDLQGQYPTIDRHIR